MMVTTKKVNRNVNRIAKTLLGAMPAIPYIMRSRKRTPIAAFILGGLGIAALGGLAALMLLSPRTRSRALSAAKSTYEKVNDTILHHRAKEAEAGPMSNGLVEQQAEEATSPT